MKIQGIAAIVAFAPVMFPSSAASMPLPRACSTDAGGHLQLSDAGVHSSLGRFIDDAGSSVSFEVYSLAELRTPGIAGISPNEMCLRYELKNTGATDIEGLRWPHIGVPWYVFPIRPDHQPPGWLDKKFDVYPTPGIYDTTIGAYRRSSETVHALFAQRLHRVAHEQIIFDHFDLAQFAPDLAERLAAHNFPVKPVLAFSAPSDSYLILPELHNELIAGEETAISMSSYAEFDQGTYTIQYKIDASDNAEVMAPLLLMILEMRPPQDESGVNLLIDTIDSFVDSAIMGIDFMVDININEAEFNNRGLFVVEHPVTVRSTEGEACLTYQTYSPLPVHVSPDKCNLSAEVIERFR